MAVDPPEKILESSVTVFPDEDVTLAKLRKTYPGQLLDLKNLFNGWSDADLLYALDEAEGAVDLTFYRISEGHAERWEEVVKRDKKGKKKGKQDVHAINNHGNKTTNKYAKPNQKSTSSKRDDEVFEISVAISKEESPELPQTEPKAATQQRLRTGNSSYRARGRGARRGGSFMGIRVTNESNSRARINCSSEIGSSVKFDGDAVKSQKKQSVSSSKIAYSNLKFPASKSPSESESGNLHGSLESHNRASPMKDPLAVDISDKDATSFALQPHSHTVNVNTRIQSDTHVGSTPSWAQMVKTAIKAVTKEEIPAKEEFSHQKSRLPLEEPTAPTSDYTIGTRVNKTEEEQPDKVEIFVEHHQKEEPLNDGFTLSSDISPKIDTKIPEVVPFTESRCTKYTLQKGHVRSNRVDIHVPRASDLSKFTSSSETPSHRHTSSVKKESVESSVKTPAFTLHNTLGTKGFNSTQSHHAHKPETIENKIEPEAEILKSVPISMDDMEIHDTGVVKQENSGVFTSPRSQEQDVPVKISESASCNEKYSKKPLKPASQKTTVIPDSLTSRFSSLSVKFGSVHLNPKSHEDEKKHIVFPSLIGQGPINYVRSIHNDDSSSENSDAEQDEYTYSSKVQQPQNLTSIGGIRSFQGAQNLFNILQGRNSPDAAAYKKQDTKQYQPHPQAPQKVGLTVEHTTFEPPTKSSFILPQSSVPITDSRSPIPVKHSPEQQAGARVFNRYPLGQPVIPSPAKQQTRISSLSTSSAQQIQSSGSTSINPAPPQVEIPCSTFSHASIATQDTQVASTLDCEFQNRGPMVPTNVALPLPLQPLNQQHTNSVHQGSYHIPVQQSHSQQSFMHQQLPHTPCPAPYHYMPFYVPDMSTPYYGFSMGNTMRYHQMYHSQSHRNHSHSTSGNLPRNAHQNTGEQHDNLEQQIPSSEGLFQLQMPHLFPVQNHMCGVVHQQYARDRHLSSYSDISNSPTDHPPVRGGTGGEFRGSRNDFNQQQDLHMFGLHCGPMAPSGNHQCINKTSASMANNPQPPGEMHGDYLPPGSTRRHQLYDQHTIQTTSSASSVQNPSSVPGVLINQNQSLASTGAGAPPMGTTNTKGAIPGAKVPYHNQPYTIPNFNDTSSQQECPPFSDNPQQDLRQNSFYSQNRPQPHFWLNSE